MNKNTKSKNDEREEKRREEGKKNVMMNFF